MPIRFLKSLLGIFKRRSSFSPTRRERVEDFILGVKSLAEKRLSEVMVPRVDMVCVSEKDTVENALRLFKKYHFSRMPVIKSKKDEVIGVLYFKELLFMDFYKDINKRVTEIMKEPHFFPETKNALEALKEMREKRIHFALVVDEFGSVTGLVTLEDLLEEIVGEIIDEFDLEEIIKPEKTRDGYIVSARIPIEEVKGFIDIEIPEEEEVVTLAGYIINNIKRIPKKGEKIKIGKHTFEILDATHSRINKIKIYI
jgi:CBS domain containing-hemolysin-like protein